MVRVGIGPIPEAAGVHMAASDLGTSHTIELMMGEVPMKISSSVAPDLLATLFQLLKRQPCQPISPAWMRSISSAAYSHDIFILIFYQNSLFARNSAFKYADKKFCVILKLL